MKPLLISPVYGGMVALDYCAAVAQLVGEGQLEGLHFVRDEVRETARARALAFFLRESRAKALLMVDVDVEPDPGVVEAMGVAMDRHTLDVVAATYPRRAHPETLPFEIVPRGRTEGPYLTECQWATAGCMLIARAIAEEVTRNCHPGLLFNDPGGYADTPDVFARRYNPDTRERQDEGFSFCARVREAGGTVWLYQGPGTPLRHFGQCAYGGPRGSGTLPFRGEGGS